MDAMDTDDQKSLALTTAPKLESNSDNKDEADSKSLSKVDNDSKEELSFDNEIMLPNPSSSSSAAMPVQPVKERRESKDGKEKSRKELEEEEREKMQVLVSNFTEDQLDRYEMYRRAAFPKAAIKRIMQTITGCSVSQNVVIAMSGIAKVFIGEIVEEALDVEEEWNDSGPLQPRHLREAVRRLRAQSQVPHSKSQRTFSRT